MGKSLTKNSIFYLVYEILNVLFPFLTGMYVAHVLLPESIGQIAYAQNIVQYFVIFSFLGIPTYGMREIAKNRKDRKALNKLYTELMIINAVSTIIFLSIYLVMIFAIPDFRENISLFLVVGISIVLNLFNNSWLYTGLEEFPYISIRSLIFKSIAFALLVLWVRDAGDYMKYAAITVIGTAGNYLLNMLHAPHFVSFDFKNLDFRRHLQPIVLLVVVNLAIEIYTLVDTTMLGMLCSDENVAFYSYGSKINKILLQVVNSFTMVLVPRISAYYKEQRIEEFNALLAKAFKLIALLALPMIVGIQFTGNFLVTAIYGDAYTNSVYVLRILCFVLLLSPIGYLLGSRVLLVVGKESKMTLCVGAGAVTNIICNAALIPLFREYGAAAASVIGEVVVMIVYVLQGRRYFNIGKIRNLVLKSVSATVAMGVYLFACTFLKVKGWSLVGIQIIGAIVIYILILLLLQEELLLDILDKITRKLKGLGGAGHLKL